MTKVCHYCKLEKSLDNFHVQKAGKYGKGTMCRDCKKIDGKIRKQSLTGKYQQYQSNAKTAHREFKLTLEQFEEFWNKNCHYCGDKIVGVGIDRVNSSIGYILENLVPCCFSCNRMKSDIETDRFLEQCLKIVSNLEL